MTERLAEIASRIENMRQLGSVVTVMRGVAASRVEQSRTLILGVEAYTKTISNAIGEALNFLESPARPPEAPPDKRGLVLFCAEQGFAGAFTRRVIEAAKAQAKDAMTRGIVMLIGTRGAGVAVEEGLTPDWKAGMANQIDAAPEVARRIAEAVYSRVASGAIAALDIFYSRMNDDRALVVDRVALLPIDLNRFRAAAAPLPPITTLTPDVLLARLVDEYIYAKLCEATMHSFAAENEARMTAMSAARDNIGRRLEELAQHEAHVRQEEVTAEIVELAVGVEAQRGR
ncbi:MAG TPA: FoF1 ATP synthase subunit gamma [Parvularculaceae bacterium]|nr:FoF1 ATP synthase subunit gamma [Parvularculaceae bacterium]